MLGLIGCDCKLKSSFLYRLDAESKWVLLSVQKVAPKLLKLRLPAYFRYELLEEAISKDRLV